ncbi:CAP domain-containing protein [Aurantimonas sp. A2-1-M11]|uniref:CAP domain-containing protein n=1 Tax=Aurantimonas sp. A2-1-M11 TaxID=3113712 RepID=UPI002F92037B
MPEILNRPARPQSCLPLLAASALALLMAAGAAIAQDDATDREALRERALTLVNESRQENDLSALSLGEALNEAAASHAADMAERNYYAHTSPEGDTVRDRFLDAGGSRWQLVAENIARCQACASPPTIGDVEELHEGWMDSPPHRENILARGLDRFGYGIVAQDDGLYAVQTFAGPGLPNGLQSDESAEPLAAEKQAEEALRLVNQARTRRDLAPLEWSTALGEAADAMLPALGGEEPQPGNNRDLFGSLPADARDAWRSIAMLSAQCSGCGVAPTTADIRAFRNQWLENPGYAETLRGSDVTHIGVAMRANGEGGKAATALLGTIR